MTKKLSPEVKAQRAADRNATKSTTTAQPTPLKTKLAKLVADQIVVEKSEPKTATKRPNAPTLDAIKRAKEEAEIKKAAKSGKKIARTRPALSLVHDCIATLPTLWQHRLNFRTKKRMNEKHETRDVALAKVVVQSAWLMDEKNTTPELRAFLKTVDQSLLTPSTKKGAKKGDVKQSPIAFAALLVSKQGVKQAIYAIKRMHKDAVEKHHSDEQQSFYAQALAAAERTHALASA